MRLDKAEDCVIQKYVENLSKYGRLVQFYQTRSHAIVLYDTLPAVCIENVVCMKTKDELFQKVRLTPRLPRVILRSNSQIGLQDQQEQDARTSYDQPSGSKSFTVDYRILGRPFCSRTARYKSQRQGQRLIETFQKHPNKESFLQDFRQTKKINGRCF